MVILVTGRLDVCSDCNVSMLILGVSVVANVQDAESQYHAHEFLDATAQPKSIWISPNEVYTMHSLLSQYLDHLVSTVTSLSNTCQFIAQSHRPPSGMMD